MPLNCVILGCTNRGIPHHGQDATVRGGSRGDQSDHATKVKIGKKVGELN